MGTKFLTVDQHQPLHQIYGQHDCCLCRADARIAALESQLREREALLVDALNDLGAAQRGVERLMISSRAVDALEARAESAESALAAARRTSEYNHQEHLAANKVIDKLQSALAAAQAENARLLERIAGQKELIKTTPAAALAAIAKGINAPLACGHGLDCWDDSVKGKEHCVWCALVAKDAALASAREAVAREVFEWLDARFGSSDDIPGGWCNRLDHFLSSTGTALASEEGGENEEKKS